MRYALCVMRYALCVMRYALCVMRYALCVMQKKGISFKIPFPFTKIQIHQPKFLRHQNLAYYFGK